jgi:hypothetical protein
MYYRCYDILIIKSDIRKNIAEIIVIANWLVAIVDTMPKQRYNLLRNE